ncbi:uncharacterized protein LOC122274368 [Carya illinoinensis]|uniref:uncharacterized protein LOC122274368 n=1 Tax=Carya illinoinensis TaxID=32201 RepID=UPI001C7299DF|nr:uncharacterized protein LOC122274368 [Carya illinoinensis]
MHNGYSVTRKQNCVVIFLALHIIMQSHLEAGGMRRPWNYQGDRAGPSSRGGGRIRGIRARRHVPYSARHNRPWGAKISSYHSPEECNQESSDDSTQPPSPPPSTNPIPTPAPIREPSPVREQSPTREAPRLEDEVLPQTGGCFLYTCLMH